MSTARLSPRLPNVIPLNAKLVGPGEIRRMKFVPFIVGTLMAGALVGWIGPRGHGATPPSGTSDMTEAAARLEMVKQRAAWNAGEVVLPRSADGHFYADQTVEGVSAHMLVDTGASVVALTGEDAEAIGLTWDEQDVEPVAQGASGPVYVVRIMLDRIELGDVEARSVEAIVVPEGLGVSLLGQSFLSQVPRVQMELDSMVLGG